MSAIRKMRRKMHRNGAPIYCPRCGSPLCRKCGAHVADGRHLTFGGECGELSSVEWCGPGDPPGWAT